MANRGGEVGMAVAPLPYGLSSGAEISRMREVEALCDGAALLNRGGNRIAALALLWAAVAVDPTGVTPHRRLAAMLANAGDVARSLSESVPTPEEPTDLGPFVALPGGRPNGNDERQAGHSEPSVPLATAMPASSDPLVAFDEVARRVDAMELRRVGFTSAASGEGVSTTALGIALGLAGLRGESVLLVDANWLRPSLTADAGLESAPGLADY